jgi:hypothetical protein
MMVNLTRFPTWVTGVTCLPPTLIPYRGLMTFSLLENPDGGGWTAALLAFIRLDTTYAPHGQFPVYAYNVSVPEFGSTVARVGYDAVVCIEHYESWIVDTYISKGGPVTSILVDRRSYLSDLNSPGKLNHTSETVNKDDLNLATKNLTSTNKLVPFQVASNNSGFTIWKASTFVILYLGFH